MIQDPVVCAFQIESQKVEWKVQSRVGSMDNARHKAGGGDKKVPTLLEVFCTSRIMLWWFPL